MHDITNDTAKDNKVEAVDCFAYLALGCWGETAGLEDETEAIQWRGISPGQFTRSTAQIRWMRKACEFLAACKTFESTFRVFCEFCDGQESVSPLLPL